MSKNPNKGKEKSLQEKVKQFFGIRGPSPVNFEKLKSEFYTLSNESLKDISPDNTLHHRLKSLKELYQVVRAKRLEDNAVEAVCKVTADMLSLQYSTETRHIVLQFYCCLIQGQLEKLDIMRSYFFRLIRNHKIVDDISPRLDLLKALSENGKSITYFEGDIGPFLLEWFPEVIAAGKARELMVLMINIIKFHAAYLDDDVVAGFIQHTCNLCCSTNCEEEIQACLEMMNDVLCYSHLPSMVLKDFIFALCMTVNIEKFSQLSWKLMRNLLGTSMGHTSILTLCCFLQDKKYFKVPKLLRGAVFFIGMALWGSNKVPSLMHPPTAVLPSLLKALDCESSIVAYEIVLAVQRLIKKNGDQLQILTWDVILDIVERVLKYPDLQDALQPVPVLATSLHDLITTVEESSIEESMYTSDRLFKIIDGCSESRDEKSVIRLIVYQAQKIKPLKEGFLGNLNHLLEKYFKNEVRQPVQLKVLHVLNCARCASGYLFEDDLIDQTILQYMSHLDAVLNVVIRKAAVELLIEIAENCITKRFFEILDIIERVLNRPFDNHLENREGLSDVEAAVLGLIRIFRKKLHVLPSSHCVRIYNTLVSHVKIYYQDPQYLEQGTGVRKMIIEFLLKLRTNSRKQMGILVNDKEEFSVHVLCTSRELLETSGAPTSPPPGSPTISSSSTMSYICFTEAYQILILCIKQEKDWRVLELTLKELPKLLQNKALIISGRCSMTLLCSSLCPLVNDKSLGILESLTNTPSRFTRTELHAQVFPAIASLASYHSELESYTQRMLINALQSGLMSRSAKVCIEGLTLCTLEMRNMMFKLLPSVLLKLSQISATVGVAVPVLEFLSNLIRLPELYFSFVEDQYMSIFAIALPYTNPFKFNQYTVALAHHVIAMWFLKCRIPFRKEFAKFITKGLRSNLSVPFDESQAKNVDTPTDSGVGEFDSNEPPQSSNKAILSLHNELMEIGIDLMARFTFGMSSNVPKRSAVSEFLLDKGQRSSWLVGNKIVTITTSGCGTKAFKYGLCEKCYASCREMSKSTELEENEVVFPMKSEKVQISHERRRHRSAILRSNTTLSHELTSRSHTKDDILIHRHSLGSNDPSFYPNRPDLMSSTEESTDDKSKKDKRQLCSCWCSSWAEIHIRRPTGNTSWMMKIQNRLFLPSSPPDFPLPAITSLLLPHDDQISEDHQVYPPEQNFQQLPLEEDDEEFYSSLTVGKDATASYSSSEALACPKSHSPIRRTNSSPDMNSGWANFENLESSLQKHFPQQASTGELVDSTVPSSTSCIDSKVESVDSHQSSLHNVDCAISDFSSSLEAAPSENLGSPTKKMKERHKAPGSKPRLKLDLSLDSSTSGSSTSSCHSAGFQPREKGIFASGINQTNKEGLSSSVNPMRDRIHTISVMSPIHSKPFESAQKKPAKDMHRSGMSPSFIFLQLYHNSFYGPSVQKPLYLYQTEVISRALRVLDRIPPYDNHKIGVVYIGPGQVDNEFEILNNLYGSLRYVDFLRGLGTLIRLSDVDLQSTYVGGLDIKGDDGKYALVWHDDVMQVAFHVATIMPNKKSDASRNGKKLHIANDFVNIVYNESGEEYNISTIASQVTLASVIIRPEDHCSNVVTVKAKIEEIMKVFGHNDAYIVSDDSLPIFVRQLALHANLACLIISHQRSGQYPHVSNWLERLRKIKLLRTKVLEERSLNDDSLGAEFQPSSNIFVDDFTDYV